MSSLAVRARSLTKSLPIVTLRAEINSMYVVKNYHVSSILSKAVPKPKPMYKITYLKANGDKYAVEVTLKNYSIELNI